ncbi:MAG: hypothetical protein JW724_01710 [Candidatus Altiarchaeota archaeon]|nr:hypothetical protein [Candidatus Altiarchaeota archaeon]
MEYQTIISEYVDYGRNKFLEVSKKKVKPDETIFLNISKGFYTPEGEKRYQRGIGFPNEKEIVDSLIEKLKNVASTEPVAGEPKVEEEEKLEEVSSLEEAI